jgi:hypothetical protein
MQYITDSDIFISTNIFQELIHADVKNMSVKAVGNKNVTVCNILHVLLIASVMLALYVSNVSYFLGGNCSSMTTPEECICCVEVPAVHSQMLSEDMQCITDSDIFKIQIIHCKYTCL